jgi:hypothetical protein
MLAGASNPASVAMIRNGGASFSAIFVSQPTQRKHAATKVARRVASMFTAVFLFQCGGLTRPNIGDGSARRKGHLLKCANENRLHRYGADLEPSSREHGVPENIQLLNAPMMGVYDSQGGVQLAPDTSDPFDTSNFPSAQYPYAFETFGNNGTTPRSSSTTSSSNHSLDDLISTAPNAATVSADLKLTGSGNRFNGSDHYP